MVELLESAPGEVGGVLTYIQHNPASCTRAFGDVDGVQLSRIEDDS